MTDYTELVRKLRDLHRDPRPASAVWIFDNQVALYDAASAIEALQAQLPKRGKWIWDDKRCIYVCSVCGLPKVRENMDRKIIKEQAYCYSCGAKMIGEQNVE